MICVPTSFSLAGRTWNVTYHDMLDNDPDLYGDCDGAECIIRLRKGQRPEVLQHTFYHEVTHAICYSLGWTELNEDEGKIDALANVLLQFLKTKRGNITTP